MSTVPVTLDSIRAAAELKYGGYAIAISETETLTLRNPLRMSKADRAALTALQDVANEDDGAAEAVDQEQVLADLIVLVADNKSLAHRFIEAVDGDLAVLSETFSQYGEKVQVGEASASQS